MSCLDSSKHSFDNLVMIEANTIKDRLLAYKIKHGTFPVAFANNEIPDFDIVQKELNLDNNETYRDLFVDPWKNPYRIHFDADKDHIIVIGKKSFTADILIYSDGPNRKNDFGAGDDIIFIWTHPESTTN